MITLKQALKEQGRKFSWLSKELEITPQTLRNWRTENDCPKVYKEKICSLLGLDDFKLGDL
jgi:hypothetical protein